MDGGEGSRWTGGRVAGGQGGGDSRCAYQDTGEKLQGSRH